MSSPLAEYTTSRECTPAQNSSKPHAKLHTSVDLTVRLLAARAGTTTTELLGLAAAGVGDQKRAVIRHKELLKLQSRGSIVVLGVVGDKGLGNSLADGVYLRSVTTTRDTDANVDGAEALVVKKTYENLSSPTTRTGS